MYVDKIYDELIAEMVKKLQATSLDEFENYREWAEKNHNIITNLLELKRMEPQLDNEVENATEVEDIVVEPTEPYPLGRNFIFEKKAFGGVLTELNYPIPEELVRNYELESGYVVRITGTNGSFTDGSPRYMFEVVGTDREPNPQLMEVRQGLVTRIGGRLAIQQTANGKYIKVDDMPVVLFIQERDIITRNHRIAEGDIVDGRFYVNNLTNSFRVTYKHDTESELRTTIEERKLIYRQHNTTETESGLSMIERLDTTPFLNKRIALVGLSSRMTDFKNDLSKVDGIQFMHLTGDESEAELYRLLADAEYVVISTEENGHSGSYGTAKACNSLGIPFTSTRGKGLTSVLMDLKRLIDSVEKEKVAV